jgi:hypothetical protein
VSDPEGFLRFKAVCRIEDASYSTHRASQLADVEGELTRSTLKGRNHAVAESSHMTDAKWSWSRERIRAYILKRETSTLMTRSRGASGAL